LKYEKSLENYLLFPLTVSWDPIFDLRMTNQGISGMTQNRGLKLSSKTPHLNPPPTQVGGGEYFFPIEGGRSRWG